MTLAIVHFAVGNVIVIVARKTAFEGYCKQWKTSQKYLLSSWTCQIDDRIVPEISCFYI